MDPGNHMKKMMPPGHMGLEQLKYSPHAKVPSGKGLNDGFHPLPGGSAWMPSPMWPGNAVMRPFDQHLMPKGPKFVMYQMPGMPPRQMHQGPVQHLPPGAQMRMHPPAPQMGGLKANGMSPRQLYKVLPGQMPMIPTPMHAPPHVLGNQVRQYPFPYHQQRMSTHPPPPIKRMGLPKMKVPPHTAFKISGGPNIKIPHGYKHSGYRQMPPHLYPKSMPPMMPLKSPSARAQHDISQPLPSNIHMQQFTPNRELILHAPPSQQPSPPLGPSTQTQSKPAESLEPIEKQVEKEVIKLLESQAKKATDLLNFEFRYSDNGEVARTLMDEFIPLLRVLWDTTKEIYEYSLDETFLSFTQDEEKASLVERDFTSLQDYYKLKRYVNETMSRKTLHIPVPSSEVTNGAELDAATLTRAREYAEVSFNQRHLLQKITALDYRSALLEAKIQCAMPEHFRLKQIEMATTLHFDLATPPQCVSPPAEQADAFAAESILSRCYTNLQNTGFSQSQPAVATPSVRMQQAPRMSKLPPPNNPTCMPPLQMTSPQMQSRMASASYNTN